MAALQTVDHINMDYCGYEPHLFVDQNAATMYQCGICKKVCKDAVEITEKSEDENHPNDNIYNTTEGSLFCYGCITKSNMPHTYNPVKFIRNAINNLIVTCPYSIRKDSQSIDHEDENFNSNDDSLMDSIESLHREISTEGDAPQINCNWKGKLSSLDDHVNHECLHKPYIECPFGCHKTRKQITRVHFEENQTQHINKLLSMVQTLTSQLSQCQNKIMNLERQMNENKVLYQREIAVLRQQIPSPTLDMPDMKQSVSHPVPIPPPPPFPPLPKEKLGFASKSRSKKKTQSMPNLLPNLNRLSSCVIKRPADAIASDFMFQVDHPTISVIANGRTAICTENKDILIEFGQCVITNRPTRKFRTRERDDSSIDDLFVDPATYTKNKHSWDIPYIDGNDDHIAILNTPGGDDNDDGPSSFPVLKKEHRRFTLSFKKIGKGNSNGNRNRNKDKKKKGKHRKIRSDVLTNKLSNLRRPLPATMESKGGPNDDNNECINPFSMSNNALNPALLEDKIKCWNCFVFIEEFDESKSSNIGIAMIKDSNDGLSILYNNGDYIDMDKNKNKDKNGFGFGQGDTLRIIMKWKGFHDCFVDILNINTKISKRIDNLDIFTKFGFILNQSRITIIEQYWK